MPTSRRPSAPHAVAPAGCTLSSVIRSPVLRYRRRERVGLDGVGCPLSCTRCHSTSTSHVPLPCSIVSLFRRHTDVPSALGPSRPDAPTRQRSPLMLTNPCSSPPMDAEPPLVPFASYL